MQGLHEPIKDATTPKEMRAEMFRLSYHEPLIRGVFNEADYTGMSAEDRYTVLAYLALKERNNLGKRLLELINCTPAPVYIMNDGFATDSR